MRRYRSSKQLQGEKYLRDRNLLVSPATLRLTEEIKRKAHRTQLKEDAKRVLRSRRVLPFRQTLLPRDQSTQTDDEYLAFLEDDVSDTSTEDLIFVPVNPSNRLSIIARTVSFCLKLSFTLISGIVICTLIGYYLRVYHSYSRL